MTDSIYQIEAETIRIEDNALGISIEAPFQRLLLPENVVERYGEESHELGGGWSIHFQGDQHSGLEASLVKKGMRQGQSLRFFPSGAVKAESFYREDYLHGPSSIFSQDGQILARTWFVDGKREGCAEMYHRNGATQGRWAYRGGCLHGLQETFFETGLQKSKLGYRAGRLHGEVSLYHENGALKRALTYEEGIRIGTEKEFDRLGRPLVEKEYQAGRLVHEKYWAAGVLIEERHIPRGDGNLQRADLKKWDTNGVLRQEILASSDQYVRKEWNGEGQLVKELYGAFEKEKLSITDYVQGKVSQEEALLFPERSVAPGTVFGSPPEA